MATFKSCELRVRPARSAVVRLTWKRTRLESTTNSTIPPRSVNILVGDSGIGKSPLAYQLGLCVAAGVPFLGMETQAGLVIMCDYENGMEESLNLSDQLARFLKLPEVPKNFVVWSPDYSHTDSVNIERMMQSSSATVAVCGRSSLNHPPDWPCCSN